MKNRIIDVQNVKITISKEELDEFENKTCPTCGSCSGMYTANSMNCLTEGKVKFCQSGRCSAKLVEKSWNIRISVCMGTNI